MSDYMQQCNDLSVPKEPPSTLRGLKGIECFKWFSVLYLAGNPYPIGLEFEGEPVSVHYKREFGCNARDQHDLSLYALVLLERKLKSEKPRGGSYLEVGTVRGGRPIWIEYADVKRVIEDRGSKSVGVDMRDGKYYRLETSFDEFLKNLPWVKNLP